jgi:hypothetical protein
MNLRDDKGKWAQHQWDKIAPYTEMELFQMAFPEELVEMVILPTTNDHLGRELMLGEFYKWLGCNFFMACFQGIMHHELWWSKEPISTYDGAPFHLNRIMSLYHTAIHQHCCSDGE